MTKRKMDQVKIDDPVTVQNSKAEDRMTESADPVHTILPGPFAWCEIPARPGYEMSDEDKNLVGTFDIAAFQMAKFPVTNAQYEVFVRAGDGYGDNRWWFGLAECKTGPETTWFDAENSPRTGVSWYEAVAFCRWLSNHVGYEVRLPMEWEWQWAAEGPDRLRYPWGNTFDAKKCNSEEYRGIQGRSPVDTFPLGASGFGVMDLSGNVNEWCLNEYKGPFRTSLEGKERRALRGGAWYLNPSILRAAIRYRNYPDIAANYVGFRCVRSI